VDAMLKKGAWSPAFFPLDEAGLATSYALAFPREPFGRHGASAFGLGAGVGPSQGGCTSTHVVQRRRTTCISAGAYWLEGEAGYGRFHAGGRQRFLFAHRRALHVPGEVPERPALGVPTRGSSFFRSLSEIR